LPASLWPPPGAGRLKENREKIKRKSPGKSFEVQKAAPIRLGKNIGLVGLLSDSGKVRFVYFTAQKLAFLVDFVQDGNVLVFPRGGTLHGKKVVHHLVQFQGSEHPVSPCLDDIPHKHPLVLERLNADRFF
jgi:hypothetical protein